MMEKIQRLPTLRPGSMPARAFRRTVSGCAPSRAAAPDKSTVAGGRVVGRPRAGRARSATDGMVDRV
ncbi:hypothetical protein A8F43_08270 [Burkholderia cenocepacia]|nr:hypothetical protein A8F43_08270 [Burkholderia cenocepacia]OOB19922.1 hypothetical protein A8F68_36995 [Burkholderia cenocepacia]